MSVTTAVILAGGLGTRLRGVVSDVPKPMAPVRGRPFLEHQMDFWLGQGIRRFVLAVSYKHEAITGHFGARYRAAELTYVVEETPLGTGGGLLLAARGLSETFLVLNGDTFFDVDLAALTDFHRARSSSWSFALFRSTDTARYMGMEVDADGRVTALKSASATPGKTVNGGVYLAEPAALAASGYQAGQRASLEDDLFPGMMAAGCTLYGKVFDAPFIDIGIPDDYFRAATVLPA